MGKTKHDFNDGQMVYIRTIDSYGIIVSRWRSYCFVRYIGAIFGNIICKYNELERGVRNECLYFCAHKDTFEVDCQAIEIEPSSNILELAKQWKKTNMFEQCHIYSNKHIYIISL